MLILKYKLQILYGKNVNNNYILFSSFCQDCCISYSSSNVRGLDAVSICNSGDFIHRWYLEKICLRIRMPQNVNQLQNMLFSIGNQYYFVTSDFGIFIYLHVIISASKTRILWFGFKNICRSSQTRLFMDNKNIGQSQALTATTDAARNYYICVTFFTIKVSFTSIISAANCCKQNWKISRMTKLNRITITKFEMY